MFGLCHPCVVHVRSAGVPDEPSDPSSPKPEFPDEFEPEPRRPLTLPLVYRVPTNVIVAKFVAAGVLALAGLLFGANPTQAAIGVLAGLLLMAYGLRDVFARERLRVDGDGLRVISGFVGHRELEWAEVQRLRVDSRTRVVVRSELLEIDAGDHIFLLSRFDLGLDPAEVATELEIVRQPPADG